MGDKSRLCVVCGSWAEPCVQTEDGPMHILCDEVTAHQVEPIPDFGWVLGPHCWTEWETGVCIHEDKNSADN